MANLEDAYAGTSFWGTSNGPAAEFALIPSKILKPTANQIDFSAQPYSVPAPVIISSCQIYQQAGGTGIVALFFDATALPVDGAALSDATGFVFAVPIAAPGAILLNLVAPWHRYNNALGIIISTSTTQVTRASASTLFAVNYMAYRVG